MGLRIVSTLRAPFGGLLELAVRQALDAFNGDFDVCITPAMDTAHAEIIVSEQGVWKAAYYATLSLALDDHVRNIRDAFAAPSAAAGDAS